MRRIIHLLFNIIHVVIYHASSNVRIQLMNDTRLSENVKGSKFPDVENVFRVNGKQVKSLIIENTGIVNINSTYLKKLTHLTKLEINHNKKLTKIKGNTFVWNKKLKYLSLTGNSIVNISSHALDGLFKSPSMRGTLHIGANSILVFPRFQESFPGLKELILDNNPIQGFLPNQFSGMTSLGYLFVRRTRLRRIDENAFKSNPSLHFLTLSDNKELEFIDNRAFIGTNMRVLDISGTGISTLPSKGLENLLELKIASMPNLFDIPDSVVSIATLKTVKVSGRQRYLCCAFEMRRARLKTIFKQRKVVDPSKLCGKSPTGFAKPLSPTKSPHAGTTEDTFAGFGFGKRRRRKDFLGFLPDTKSKNATNVGSGVDDFFFPDEGIQPVTGLANHVNGAVICVNHSGEVYIDDFVDVDCTPRPDALRPCDDIMGNVGLTLLSWLIALVGLFANAFVFSVISMSRRSFSVAKFLLQNLSLADFCLSLYLLVLVCASTHTHGSYHNYVRKWQYGGGCAVAGFLAMFSCQLSVLVLFVITIERYFSIVHALRFNLRVSLPKAKLGILLSWMIAFTMAILPIFDVNSYTEVAICLPFRTKTTVDLVYIAVVLTFNVILFIAVMLSYIRMYWVIRTRQIHPSNVSADSEVAKRMALLVFTDFACWIPIAFVGLLSAFAGADILDMDVKKSKYLLVIFFPINSLCNPILYATTTNTFKKDVQDIIQRNHGFRNCLAMDDQSHSKHEGSNSQSRHLTGLTSLYNRISSKKAKQKLHDLPHLLAKRRPEKEDASLCSTPLLHERNSRHQDKAKLTNNNKPTSDVQSSRKCSATKQIKQTQCISSHTHAENEHLPLVRVRSNSEGLIKNGSISPAFKEITFDYDFSKESFLNARETVGL